MNKPEVWYTRWLHSKPEEDGEDFTVVKLEDHEKIVEELKNNFEKGLNLGYEIKADSVDCDIERYKQSLRQQIEKMKYKTAKVNPDTHELWYNQALSDVLKLLDKEKT